jgi:hypothetical protein
MIQPSDQQTQVRKQGNEIMSNVYTVSANGTEFGEYVANSEQEACDLCAQDAGYKSEADMAKQLGRQSDLVATLV